MVDVVPIHTYLLRYAEIGRDAQRGKLRRDLMMLLSESLPDACITADVGRLFVETLADAGPVCARLHGLTSYSPCVRCQLAELPARALAFAEERMGRARTFLVRIRRIGSHAFHSCDLAAELGRSISARLSRSVDLRHPEWRLGVEIREKDCFLFDQVLSGLDYREVKGAPAPMSMPCGPRFLADQMLGRLAAWLRILGFDTTYLRDQPDSVLLRAAASESRILLTRDQPLARASSVPVYLVTATALPAQVREVVLRFGLPLRRQALFSRCTLCNRPVTPLHKTDAKGRVPVAAFTLYERFTACAACGKVYWQGGHYQRVLSALADLISD